MEAKPQNYIFLGSPGVGKGTLAKLWSEKSQLVHLSTGEMFRQEIEAQTPLGKKVQAIVASGAYVPDELTNEIVHKKILSPEIQKHGFILDGYPRTINQVKFLQNSGINIERVIFLSAPKEVILQRLLGRKRPDDDPKIIAQRIEIYNQKTKPLVDYYKKIDLLTTIDVSGSVEQNFEHLLCALKQQHQLRIPKNAKNIKKGNKL